MKWLLWKDYRHNRLIVLAGLFMLLAPYLIGVCVGGVQRWISFGTNDNGQPRYLKATEWAVILGGASLYSLVISQLTIALMGGNAIAGERVDRSAEFLYSLPIPRKKLLASKLLLVLLITASIWLTDAPLMTWMLRITTTPENLPRYGDLAIIWANFAITGLTFFCVAWFLSSYIASPALAVCGGLITPWLVLSGIALVNWLLMRSELLNPRYFALTWELSYGSVCLTLAPLCFAVGTWHYLRRVEP
jgi:ABC-type transport system involved in multi-copper enzyme maturation permease subunit